MSRTRQDRDAKIVLSHRTEQRGSVFILLLVAMVGVGMLTAAHLTKVVAENRKSQTVIHAQRAQALADAELEFAKNIVNAAPYVDGRNTALAAAILANPPVVPGTRVEVEKLGDASSQWYTMRATGRFGEVSKASQTFVRERSPLSSYNFLVIDDPIGISGAPRGAIHSNKSVDFYFPWGFYRDRVTATTGFNFRGGATPQNTRLVGHFDGNAARVDLPEGCDIAGLAADAQTLKVTDDLIAEVQFNGTTTEVKLFMPQHQVAVERTAVRQVFDHYDSVDQEYQKKVYVTVNYTEMQPIYEWQQVTVTKTRSVYDTVIETVTEIQPIYEWQEVQYTEYVPIYATRTVTKTVYDNVWVEDPPPTLDSLEGGYAVAGEEPVLGHWETVSRQVTVNEQYISDYDAVTKTKLVKVKVGETTVVKDVTKQVFSHYEDYETTEWRNVLVGEQEVQKSRQEFSHYETAIRTVQVPVYRDETYTYTEQITIPEELVRTETVATDGVIYVEGPIRSIKGQVKGRVSVVSNDAVRVTDSIVYVDDQGNHRMLNGLDPTQPYRQNPDYTGDSVLAIMARGDIRYAAVIPDYFELNASLVSTEGMVGFEGMQLSADGTEVSHTRPNDSLPEDYIKESIRRLGGIVSRRRPVTTYVDASNRVLAGFRKGMSLMDQMFLVEGGSMSVPPSVFHYDRPAYAFSSRGWIMNPQ